MQPRPGSTQSQARLPAEVHPFSISRIVDEQTIRLSAKALGDYTRQLPNLQPGDEVAVSGPYGRLGARRQLVQTPMLWVAGGIGITPFLSLLQQEQSQPAALRQPTTLVWSVRKRQEALYAEEIKQAVQALPHVSFYLHVSDEEGYLTGQRLAELSSQASLQGLTMFLCGPPGMMKTLRTQCSALGLRSGSVVTEEFAIR